MSLGGASKNRSPQHHVFMCDTKYIFRSYGYRVRNYRCDMEEYPKMDPSHIKFSCGTQNGNSNLVGIGFGLHDITWRNIQN